MDEDITISDKTPVYKENDVVWVKLGSSWWPGEIVDPEKLSDVLSEFKKPPLAVVRFFDEDTYEYVRSWDHIYPYNCDRKNEFIKKGMAAFRSKSTLMGKFPVDVSSAEMKCGGNTSILSDPMFLPEKKVNYVAEVFKTPQKKGQKDIDERRGRKKVIKARGSDIPASDSFQVTHRRFLGFDDYKGYICVQFVGKDRDPEPGDEESKTLNSDPKELFHCHSCTFVTRSTELMVMHCKSHIQGIYVPTKKPPKITATSHDSASGSGSERSPIKRKRTSEKVERAKKDSPVKRKRSTDRVKRTKKEQPPVLDIRSDLLAEWDDSEEDNEEIVSSLKNKEDNEDSFEDIESENDETVQKKTTKNDETTEKTDASEIDPGDKEVNKLDKEGSGTDKEVNDVAKGTGDIDKEDNISNKEVNDDGENTNKPDKELEPLNKEVSIDDKELGNHGKEDNIADVEVGRKDDVNVDDKDGSKNDKEVSVVGKKANVDDKEDRVVGKEVEIGKVVSKDDEKVNRQEEFAEKDDKEVKKDGKAGNKGKKIVKKDEKAKKSTQEEIKSCFDFDDDDDMHHDIVVAVATSGRKIPRVIPEKRKSLTEVDTNLDVSKESASKDVEIIEDDVELDREKILKESESLNLHKEDNADEEFRELMESTAVPDLPEITHNTLKPEQNFHDGNTVKFPDKPEDGLTPSRATRLTSPKKRFVKSFEDFELEMKRKVDEEMRHDEFGNSEFGNSVANSKQQQEEIRCQIVLAPEESEKIARGEQIIALEPAEVTLEQEKIEPEDQESPEPPKNLPALPVKAGRSRRQPKKDKSFQFGQRWSSRNLKAHRPEPLIAEKSEKCAEKLKSDVEKPKIDVKKPKIDVEKPKIDVEKPEIDVEKPKIEMNEPKIDVEKLKIVVENPKIEVNESKIEVEEPKVEVEEPKVEIVDEVVTIEEQSGVKVAEAVEKMAENVEEMVVLEPKVKKKRGRPRKNSKYVEETPIADRTSKTSEETTPESSKTEDIAVEPSKIEDVNAEEPKIEDFSNEPSKIEEVPATEPLKMLEVTTEPSEIEKDDSEPLKIEDDMTEPPKNEDVTKPTKTEDLTVKTSNSEDISPEPLKTEDKSVEMPKIEDILVEETIVTEDVTIETSQSEDIVVETSVLEETVVATSEIEDSLVEKLKIEDIAMETSENLDKPSAAVETATIPIDDVASCGLQQKTVTQEKEEKQLSVAVETAIEAASEPIATFEQGPSDGSKKEEVAAATEAKEAVFMPTEANEEVVMSTETNEVVGVATEGNEEIAVASDESKGVVTATEPVLTHSDPITAQSEENNVPLTTDEDEFEFAPPLKFEKLKDRILSKLAETSEKPKYNKKGQHKTAKIKILESYREKQVEETPTERFDDFDEKPPTRSDEKANSFDDISGRSGFDFGLNDSDASLRLTVQNIIDNILPDDDEEDNTPRPVEEKPKEKEEIIFPPKKNLQKMDDYTKKKRRKTVEDKESYAVTALPPKKKILALPRGKTDKLKEVHEEKPPNKGDTSVLAEIIAEKHSEVPENLVEVGKSARETFDLGEMLAHNKDSYPIEERLLHPNDESKTTPEEMVGHKNDELPAEDMENYSKSDDFSPSFELPEDAICLPSRRSTRRKTIEDKKSEESAVLKRKSAEPALLKGGKRKRKSVVVEETATEVPEEQIEIEQIPMDTEQIVEETVITTDNIVVEDEHKNEMEVKLTSNNDDDDFKFSIQTNLTNFSKVEEMSAVALATLSEIQAEKKRIETETNEQKLHPSAIFPLPAESELVQVEGNVTVMSEKDLVDSQVEITTEKIISSKKKPVTLTSFSMDYDQQKVVKSVVKPPAKNNGTEFSSRAMTNKVEKLQNDKTKTYERMELLDILEGNSDSSGSSSCEQKFKESFDAYDKTDIVQGICDFEECIPQQIVVAKPKEEAPEPEEEHKKPAKSPSKRSKLLERLTEPKVTPDKTSKNVPSVPQIDLNAKINETVPKALTATNKIHATATRTTPLGGKQPAKFVIKTTRPPPKKPIILSEQLIKTTSAKSPKKTAFQDVEDVEAFVIPKDVKKSTAEDDTGGKKSTTSGKASGRAKILHQTIITAEGEIIQPSDASAATAQTDFNVFDINSMPIVLSDQILTPESIENMPIMLGSDEKVATPAKKIVATSANLQQKVAIASPLAGARIPGAAITKTTKPRILQNTNTKPKGNSPLLPNTVKAAKYIIVPSNPSTTLPQGKVLIPANLTSVASGKHGLPPKTVMRAAKIAGTGAAASPETAGNKIMIFTNQQGQQHRLLLTPQQQKMLGYQTSATQPGGKVTAKTIIKSGVLPEGIAPGPSGVLAKSPGVPQRVTAQNAVTQSGLLMSGAQTVKMTKTVTKRPASTARTPGLKQQKTILIKNQHGQTVRKIQGTDDAELDKQVAEQLEAIKASTRLMHSTKQPQPQEVLSFKQNNTPKTTVRRTVTKKAEVPPKKQTKFSIDSSPVPALTPIPTVTKKTAATESPATLRTTNLPQQQLTTPVLNKPQTAPTTTVKQPVATETAVTASLATSETIKTTSQQQLVIQDALGNQTTVAVGQILALPSETVDGQPQSYMLVTLDESGNLTPLNNEALMSLDPSLGMNFDVNNMVLELDHNKATLVNNPAIEPPPVKPRVEPPAKPVIEPPPAPVVTSLPPVEAVVNKAVVTTQQPASNNEIVAQHQQQSQTGGQQLIVTGDPIATQKFLESLSEGTTDLANILANAEGSSILIQADGQQILINTNSDSQMLMNVAENTEAGGNPIFSTQPSKNQDILAAALADTDVFQPEQHHPPTQKLSPGSTLYPMNVGNVLETSLTLGSPIMTPLEVPSTNAKKIDDSTDILSQVPKNVDLPITITDPNISQTVAQQHVANLMAAELSLPISEATISVASTEMSNPSFVYSLPSLEVDMSTPSTSKPFSGSMPLLTEDHDDDVGHKNVVSTSSSVVTSQRQPSFIDPDQEDGLCTLGGQICSSLSEPPPDMFDLPDVDGAAGFNRGKQDGGDEEISSDLSSVQAETSSVNSEGSGEIPLQPKITVSLDDLEPRPRRTEEENGPSGNHKMVVD